MYPDCYLVFSTLGMKSIPLMFETQTSILADKQCIYLYIYIFPTLQSLMCVFCTSLLLYSRSCIAYSLNLFKFSYLQLHWEFDNKQMWDQIETNWKKKKKKSSTHKKTTNSPGREKINRQTKVKRGLKNIEQNNPLKKQKKTKNKRETEKIWRKLHILETNNLVDNEGQG